MSVLLIVLPIFALILTGWIARRLGLLGAAATTELNRFVVWLALPALLFDIVANAEVRDLWLPDFIAVFGLGAGILFFATVLVRLRRVPLADAAVDGLNASYANTGYVGFPLALAVLGPSALGPTLIAALLTVCALFGLALVLIEFGLQTEKSRWRMLRKVGGSLIRNPLIAAPALGAVLLASGLELPAPADAFLKLLGGAASPCALVALGLFLADKREASPAGGAKLAAGLIGLKLIVHPLLTWILATQVFGLSPQLTQTAVLLAALPTGTGPFMVAEFYRREAGGSSLAVLGSTILSVLTITLYLNFAL